VLHAPFAAASTRRGDSRFGSVSAGSQFNFEMQGGLPNGRRAVLSSDHRTHSRPDVFVISIRRRTRRRYRSRRFATSRLFQTRWAGTPLVPGRSPPQPRRKEVPPSSSGCWRRSDGRGVTDAGACLEKFGRSRVPDHPWSARRPLIAWKRAMDFDALSAVLTRIHGGAIRCVDRDTPEPSAASHEISTPAVESAGRAAGGAEDQAVYTRRAGERMAQKIWVSRCRSHRVSAMRARPDQRRCRRDP